VTDLELSPTPEALAERAAERIAAAAAEAIAAHGRFVIALSGGLTPGRTLGRLAEAFVSRLDWARVHVLWGDERCVPPDGAASNYGMARRVLLDHVPIPQANVHRIHGEDDPAQAAERYEADVRALLATPAGPPRGEPGRRIDLVLLGLGEDGHTASLFPGGAALHERTRWALPARGGRPPVWRVTLTPPVIEAAAEALFLVSGSDKASVLSQVLDGPERPNELPAQAIALRRGRVRWSVDADAAAELKKEARLG
jgi:6-phosphogluconolactonase